MGAKLEQRVGERTAELFKANEQLKKEIEERIHAQEDLRKAELRYRTVADFTYDWEYWSNHDGQMQYVSPSCERITGYKAREFIEDPKLIRNIIESEDLSDWDQHIHGFPAKLEPQKIQFRIRRRDGQTRWIEQHCQPVFNTGGEFKGLRASNRDVTQRKRVEDSLQQSKENYRMLADRLLKAQESERRRLAREMHDDMTQRLAVLAIDARELEQEMQSTPGPTLERLRQMRESLIKLSDDIHAISRRLHPSIIDDLGLVDAVESECTNFSRRYGIPINWSAEEIRPDISKDIALSIYRVVQESLRNVAKHSRATEVTVALTGNDNFIHLFVQDNGVGFDTWSEKRTSGLGLASMKERIHLIQGDFSIRSRTGQGTILEIQVPTTKYNG